ncbi:MAG TPA: galactokinase, partial [Solirubrobacteraceae bacterium]
MARERSVAFAPGRVNLIGEHTDYNDGLALPFAIAQGITVSAAAHEQPAGAAALIEADALDLGEHDEFALAHPAPAEGWRAFVHGVVAELGGAGVSLRGASLRIGGEVPRGSGLSSSAALEVALCLALLELADAEPMERIAIARLCARVENDWVGARTGLLDQLASLFGAPEHALCIDFRSLSIEPVPLRLHGWSLAVLDSGEAHANAASGYNQRRAECARACEQLKVSSLRDAREQDLDGLPEPLGRRAAHVIGENRRVHEAVSALRAEDLPALGRLLDACHESLRDLYEISTPAVEATVERMRSAGATGARLVGGGFGGGVLGLFEPGVSPPRGALEVRPG